MARSAWMIAVVSCAHPDSPDGWDHSSQEQAITAGTPDGDDPAAVALVAGTQVLCSGVLVAPRVVLTAGHCVDPAARPDVFFGAEPAAGGERRGTLDVRIHPELDRGTFAFDLALLLLDAAAPPAAIPWPPVSAPLDAAAVGATLRIVGFGMTSPTDTAPPRKRTGTTTIASVGSSDLGFASDPSHTCVGDSGGPALIADNGGGERLAGIHSSGDPGCAGPARATRVDPFLASFVLPYVGATAEGAAATGERCFYEANCREGTCVVAGDEPRLRYCSRTCADPGDCPAGMLCLQPEGLCRHPPPTPGALGSTCELPTDCVTGRCARPAADAPALCTTTCFADLPESCPTGYRCGERAGAPGALACFPAEERGGSCRAGGGSTGWGLSLLLAGLWAARRRGRGRGRQRSTRIEGSREQVAGVPGATGGDRGRGRRRPR